MTHDERSYWRQLSRARIAEGKIENVQAKHLKDVLGDIPADKVTEFINRLGVAIDHRQTIIDGVTRPPEFMLALQTDDRVKLAMLIGNLVVD